LPRLAAGALNNALIEQLESQNILPGSPFEQVTHTEMIGLSPMRSSKRDRDCRLI
jgi:anaerobic nitric oxide reductase transcription regulator